MKNNVIALVYFDDTQIVGQIAQVDCGQAVTPLATVRKEYSGIYESNFADREDFIMTFNSVVSELAQSVNHVPEILHIGVANQFCHVETQNSELEFDHMTKVNRHHLQALWSNTHFDTTHCEIIAKQALYFKLEEYDNVLIDVLGVSTCGLEMISSAISISNEFRPMIDMAHLRRAGFTDIAFVATAACELFMIPEKARDAGCTLVRSDLFSTSVANVIGDGLTHLSHFNFGTGHLISEIVENFGVDYDSAMQLLTKCTPTFEMLLEETYHANGQTVPANIFNDTMLKQINEFASRLANLETARIVYLSGGNFDRIYGVRNILANTCGRKFYTCQDALTGHMDYPENTLNAMIRYIYEN